MSAQRGRKFERLAHAYTTTENVQLSTLGNWKRLQKFEVVLDTCGCEKSVREDGQRGSRKPCISPGRPTTITRPAPVDFETGLDVAFKSIRFFSIDSAGAEPITASKSTLLNTRIRPKSSSHHAVVSTSHPFSYPAPLLPRTRRYINRTTWSIFLMYRASYFKPIKKNHCSNFPPNTAPRLPSPCLTPASSTSHTSSPPTRKPSTRSFPQRAFLARASIRRLLMTCCTVTVRSSRLRDRR